MATNNKLRAINSQASTTRQKLKVDRWSLNATYIEGDLSDLSEISFQSLKETLVSPVDFLHRVMFRKNFVNIFFSRVTIRTIMMNCQKNSHFFKRGSMGCPYESFSARMGGFFGEFHEEILSRVSWTPMDGPWQVPPWDLDPFKICFNHRLMNLEVFPKREI